MDNWMDNPNSDRGSSKSRSTRATATVATAYDSVVVGVMLADIDGFDTCAQCTGGLRFASSHRAWCGAALR